MARARLISRSLGTSIKFNALAKEGGKLGEFCQLLYTLIIPHTDDFGRMAADTFTVKHAVLPASRRTEAEFGTAIACIAQVGLVSLCEDDNRIFLEVKDFDKHQSGLSRRTVSVFPECHRNSVNFSEIHSELNRTELNRTEENRAPKIRAREQTQRVSDGTFENFWIAYPKKKAKAEAKRAWDKIRPSEELLQRMLAAISTQRTSDDWAKDGGKYIPFPATWLNRGQWDDADAEVARPLRTSEVKTYQEIQAEEWKWQTEHAKGPKNAS